MRIFWRIFAVCTNGQYFKRPFVFYNQVVPQSPSPITAAVGVVLKSNYSSLFHQNGSIKEKKKLN